jgi:hypothetical protein
MASGDMGIAEIHPDTFAIRDDNARELRLQLVIEGDREVMRRHAHGAVDRRYSLLRIGMGEDGGGGEKHGGTSRRDGNAV